MLLVVAVALVVVVGCSSMKVNHDYDHQADFSQYKTYAWYDSDTNMADTDPLNHERFITAVDRQLSAKGFSKVSSNPDVLVTYHAEETQTMSLDTTYMGGGWGYGPGWGWGGGYAYGGDIGSTTTTMRHYSVGTVALDMWDAKEKRLIWRCTVTDTVSENPRKNAEKIQIAAKKFFEHYPPSGG